MHTAVLSDRDRVARISWHYAREADLIAYYGVRPPSTVRAIIVTMDDEPAGIVGIIREAWTSRFFSEYKEPLQPFLKSVIIMRAVKAALDFVKNYPTAVYARAQHKEGCRILQRLGFVETDVEDVFVWPK